MCYGVPVLLAELTFLSMGIPGFVVHLEIDLLCFLRKHISNRSALDIRSVSLRLYILLTIDVPRFELQLQDKV